MNEVLLVSLTLPTCPRPCCRRCLSPRDPPVPGSSAQPAASPQGCAALDDGLAWRQGHLDGSCTGLYLYMRNDV